MSPGPDALLDRLAALARTPVLLVASDYDGTLAPIVRDPDQARPLPGAVAALAALAALPDTCAAVVSGRALDDLARLLGAPDDVLLVGSHGGEFGPGFAASLAPAARALHERVAEELARIAAGVPGARLERKPASVALHYREVAAPLAAEALRRVEAGPAAIQGVVVKHGKKVIELGVLSAHKGTALAQLRERAAATAVAFLGDDVTDEDGFAALRGADLGIKVGPGATRAALRIGEPQDVARVLAALAALRAAHAAGRAPDLAAVAAALAPTAADAAQPGDLG